MQANKCASAEQTCSQQQASLAALGDEVASLRSARQQLEETLAKAKVQATDEAAKLGKRVEEKARECQRLQQQLAQAQESLAGEKERAAGEIKKLERRLQETQVRAC